MYGFQVYTTEVDDRGIDFVTRYEKNNFLTIQVKSVRSLQYMYLRKDKFEISKQSYLALVLLTHKKAPKLFLIPSEAWLKPNKLFVDYDYVGKKSKPEYGLRLSAKNLLLLEPFLFEKTVELLTS